jgi:hypothetical protein
MKKPVLALVIVFLFLTACKKPQVSQDCNTIGATTLSYAALVDAGDTIKFFAIVPGDPIGFSWTGPGGFTSNSKNAIVPKAQTNASGIYKLDVDYGNGCIKTVSTNTITVSVPSPPCTTLGSNKANLSDTAVATFTTMTTSAVGNTFTFNANGASGKIVMQFLNTSRPPDGVYTIEPQGGISQFGYVRFRYETMGEPWQASTGNVFVRSAGGKITLSFCSVVVRNTTQTANITLSGEVTEP